MKYGSELSITGSRIASDNDSYWAWNLAGSTTHYGYEIKSEEGREPDYYDFVMVLAGSYHGRFRVSNSSIENSAHLFFDSPYDLDISGTQFLDLHEIDMGNYTFEGSYEDAVKEMRTFPEGDKGLWIYTDDMNLDGFNLKDITLLSAAGPLNVTFLINAYRDRLNVYNADIDGNIVIKESLTQTHRQSHTVYADGSCRDGPLGQRALQVAPARDGTDPARF